MTGSGHSPQKPEPDRVEAVKEDERPAALGVLGGAGEERQELRQALAKRVQRTYPAVNGWLIADVVLEELEARAALAGGPHQNDEGYGTSGPGACGPGPDVGGDS